MATSRSTVLSLYKRLHRTSQSVFAGDSRMIEGARVKIKEEFWKNRNVTSVGAVQELIKVGEDSVMVLKTSVIQAAATDSVDPHTGKQIYRQDKSIPLRNRTVVHNYDYVVVVILYRFILSYVFSLQSQSNRRQPGSKCSVSRQHI